MTTSSPMPRLLAVGAGHAGTSIVRAVRAEELAEVGAVVDPAPPERDWVSKLVAEGKAYPSIDQLPPDGGFDVAAVAVPTPLHFAVLQDLLSAAVCPPLVLCEKPLTTTAEEAERLQALAAARGVTLRMLLHFSAASEVAWLATNIGRLAERLGPVAGVASDFGDDYWLTDLASARRRLGNPWLDSGVNSLSVVLQFVDIAECVERRQERDPAVAVRYVGTRGEEITIRTVWDDPARAKRTTISFRDGDVEVDHLASRVVLDGTELYRSSLEARRARYSALMARHLGGEVGRSERALETNVLSWLFAPAGK